MRSPAEIHIYTWIHYTEAKTREKRARFLLSTEEAITSLAVAKSLCRILCVLLSCLWVKTRAKSRDTSLTTADDRTLKLTVTLAYTYVMHDGMFKSSEYKDEGLAMEKRYGCEIENSKQTHRAILRVKCNRKVNFPSTNRGRGFHKILFDIEIIFN